jgi:hypothetical protein
MTVVHYLTTAELARLYRWSTDALVARAIVRTAGGAIVCRSTGQVSS